METTVTCKCGLVHDMISIKWKDVCGCGRALYPQVAPAIMRNSLETIDKARLSFFTDEQLVTEVNRRLKPYRDSLGQIHPDGNPNDAQHQLEDMQLLLLTLAQEHMTVEEACKNFCENKGWMVH
jgi:hypothetical protein